MRKLEAFGVPRLVCPACGRPVEPATSVGGQVVCTGCLRRLDLVALAQELAALIEATGTADPEVAVELWLRRLDLSGVEREVLDLLLQGYRVSQIAAHTGTSESTVRKRLRRLLAKTGTRSQAELVARCRAGVVGLGAQPDRSAAGARRSRRPRT
jgi:DNA-binding CsgD family transcriptional regulator